MKVRSIFLALIIMAFALAIFSLTREQPRVRDSLEYQSLSKNLLKSNVHYAGNLSENIDFRLYSKRTLGYPLHLLFQGNSYSLQFAQFLMYGLLSLLGLFLLQGFAATAFYAKLYLWFLMLTPVLLLHLQFVLSDLLLACAILLCICIVVEKRITNKTRLILISFLWMLALAIKPVMLPSVVLIPFVIGYFKIRFNIYSWFSLAPFVLLFFVLLLNKQNSDIAEYSSISTINLAHYNAKLTIASKYGNDSAQNFTNSPVFAIPHNLTNYSTYKKNLNNIAKRVIIENVGTYSKIHIIGMLKMMLDPGRWEIYTFFNKNTADNSLTELLFAKKWRELKHQLSENKILFVLFVSLLIFNTLKLLGLLFALFKPSKTMLLLAGVMCYFLLITGPIGAARFMLPGTIFILVLSVYGWKICLDFFQKRSKR